MLHMEKCPAGCGPVAIAQILAFHKLSQKYDFKSESYYERIKDRVPELKNWDGIYNWEEMTKKEEADYLSDEGHYWVIDGYCRLFCKAKNKRSGEIKNIVANYVHCNAGWHGINNGYYIDGLFTFNNPKANAEDHQIRSTYGKNNYYQYGITMFNNVVPK